MLTFEPGGRIKLFNGSYTDYYNEHKKIWKSINGADNNVSGKNQDGSTDYTGSRSELTGAQAYKQQKQLQNKKLKFTFSEQREYETIESDIAGIEERIEALEKGLADPAIASDFVKLSELTAQKEAAEALLDEKMERYVYLEDLAEKIRANDARSGF